MSVKCIWVTWERQRRNIGISSALGWKLYEIICNKQKIVRYTYSLYKTVTILIHEKPDYVAAQNPSIVLALTVVLLKYLFGYKSIIDAHNAGLFPCENKNIILNTLSKIIQSLSDWTIVTNDALAGVVDKNNGKAIVLPDKLPDPPDCSSIIELQGAKNIAFICTFSSDEPYNEVIEAAKLIPDDICIYITGKYTGKANPDDMPSNVKLLGFIPDDTYWNLISAVDGIIVLTTREDCLVCGGYEAVSLGKPMILSGTYAIMKYFHSGCVYTKPHAEDIRGAILLLIEKQVELSAEVICLEAQLRCEWEDSFTTLLKEIGVT